MNQLTLLVAVLIQLALIASLAGAAKVRGVAPESKFLCEGAWTVGLGGLTLLCDL